MSGPGDLADDLAALSLDQNGVAWGEGTSRHARRARRIREAQGSRASTPSLVSQSGTVAGGAGGGGGEGGGGEGGGGDGDDNSSILTREDAASVTGDVFGRDGNYDFENPRYSKLFILQCLIAEFGELCRFLEAKLFLITRLSPRNRRRHAYVDQQVRRASASGTPHQYQGVFDS